ncbi:MAG TPA: radical SAM family RiPP maturation amino acid epimerase, partial [Dongiaceae bacterium]|nr:radical SAM family RiPP maturation amino acid epimerase [Dongiaceae bacterium]
MISLATEPRILPPPRALPDNGQLRYWHWLDRQSDEQHRTLSEIKRLLERYRADERFRTAFRQPGADLVGLAARYGIRVDPRDVWPVLLRIDPDLPADGGPTRTALADLWEAYRAEMLQCLEDFLGTGDRPDANPSFAAWRRRQISRVKSELGEMAQPIKHPVIAFELSAGCSVGCWFCGVGAGKFQENYPYTPETRRLWRDLLTHCTEFLGDSAQTGFCYWATEPTDNPNYVRFIEDFHDITGVIPSTTTAMPLRDPALTRQILDLQERYGGLPNRFSILTLRTFERVHATFSALELLGVELVLQNPEAIQEKAFAGRARDKAALVEKHNRKPASDNATIACVSGFLVNMVSGAIRLVSPVAPSERWPLGYRVYGERRFKSAPEFRRAMEELVAEHMPMTISASSRLAFRGDLAFERQADRFTLGSRGARYALGGFAGAG